jgi:small-conductance mechanosensitive channel
MVADGFRFVTDSPYGVVLLVLLVSFGAGAVMNFVVIRYLRTYTERTATNYDSIVVDNLHSPLVTTVSLIGLALLATVGPVTEQTVLTEGQVSTFVGKPLVSIIILVWGFYLNRVVNEIVETIDIEGTASDTRGRTYELAPVFSNVWTLTVITTTGASLLVLWDYDISPLLGAAGIAGIALGIAAKESVGNFIGGLALYIDDTYTIGDYLELDTGEAGTVVAVGVRSTTLRTRDNIEITLPNSMLNEEKIVNRSEPRGQTRIKVGVGVAYGTDIDQVEEVLLEIAEDEPLVQSNPEPQARFVQFGESGLEYRLVCWIERPVHEFNVRHRLNRAIYHRFRDHDIDIPYPTRDVNLYQAGDGGYPERPSRPVDD